MVPFNDLTFMGRRGGRPRTRDLEVPPLQGPGKPCRLDIPENLSIESVEFYKQSDCTHYETCLDYAARCMWNQFHCRECGDYEPLSREEQEALAEIIYRALLADD